MVRDMDPELEAVARRQGGVILRQDAQQAGYGDREIARMKASGRWRAVRRGAYADGSTWSAADRLDRHRTTVHAVARQLSVPAVVSHVSAAAMHNLAVWGVDLDTAHVTRRDRHSTRTESGVAHHRGPLDDSEVVNIDGVAVTSLARTVVDVARTVGFESAVVTADSALTTVGLEPAALRDVLEVQRAWHGARSAGRVLEFADGRSESVGESRHRVQLRRIGLPTPALQVVIVVNGREYRLDFVFEEYWTAGEFDGRGKYDRWLRPDDTPAEAVWREKLREDRIREAGFEVVRPVWADLSDDRVVAQRYREAFERGQRRHRFVG